jgi:hypothetical protein
VLLPPSERPDATSRFNWERPAPEENWPLLLAGLIAGILLAGALGIGADRCGDRAYNTALQQAEQAVIYGKQAPKLSGTAEVATWTEAARSWDEAIENLEQVQVCSKNYYAAQERLATYADNREQIQERLDSQQSDTTATPQSRSMPSIRLARLANRFEEITVADLRG